MATGSSADGDRSRAMATVRGLWRPLGGEEMTRTGQNFDAYGRHSRWAVAIGRQRSLSARWAVAIGRQRSLSARWAVAIGRQRSLSARRAVAIGHQRSPCRHCLVAAQRAAIAAQTELPSMRTRRDENSVDAMARDATAPSNVWMADDEAPRDLGVREPAKSERDGTAERDHRTGSLRSLTGPAVRRW